MKVLVTGVGGQLGYDVMRALARAGMECVGSARACGPAAETAPCVPLDITDPEAVRRVIGQVRPQAVVHCAGWTNVDAAEESQNRQAVFAANRDATRYIAKACKQAGCKLLYLSTDYVFPGTGSQPWKPDCRDFAPLNVYGRSKLEGEFAVAEETDAFFIVRIEWAFGKNGGNFVKTVLNLARTHDTLRIVDDQIGIPTYTADLARLITQMVQTEKYGYYHATNEGEYVSRYGLAREILRQAGLPTAVRPVTTAEYGPQKAVRPLNSRLDRGKLAAEGFDPLPDWQDAVRRYLQSL
jgi:dTDP-4-dehydrorhamnose reductase